MRAPKTLNTLNYPVRPLQHNREEALASGRLAHDEPMPHPGEVYFLHSAFGTKIGCARDAISRIESYASSLPFYSEIIHIIKTDDRFGLEHLFHYRFCQRHIRAEWFALTEEDIEFVKSLDGPPPRPFPPDHPDNDDIPF